ncbi:uncharacterized protein F58A4.6 isoform X2 [Leptopilina boulardi]|uniref:uncharacterized protein F58A4.6 isoform X2 n=1 Tax=Leptopilina boulardi TaxID=63433 RepID=UPI0021F59439|nr:uncharacterized protein F58A4.6 isoform X2 [Leptopilina boulardi]
MDCQLRLIIHNKSSVYDNLILMPHCLISNNTKENSKSESYFCDDSLSKYNPIPVNRKGLCSFLVSAYVSNLQRSDIFRKSAFKILNLFIKENSSLQDNKIVLIKLRNPRKYFIDYAWNERITQMTAEKREIEHAMSWLSTLGGAFSALGEEIPYCAEVAGKISLKQFKLAYRLGDPLLVARCKLYAALSLIQRGNLKQPKQMLKAIFQFAVNQKDVRLQNMCNGVWAKLKYYHDRRKQLKPY